MLGPMWEQKTGLELRVAWILLSIPSLPFLTHFSAKSPMLPNGDKTWKSKEGNDLFSPSLLLSALSNMTHFPKGLTQSTSAMKIF